MERKKEHKELYYKMKKIWKNLKTSKQPDCLDFWQNEVHKHVKRSPLDNYAYCERIVKMYEGLRPTGDDEDGLFGLGLVEKGKKKISRIVLAKDELKHIIETAPDVRVKICGKTTSIEGQDAPVGHAYLYEIKVRHDTNGCKKDNTLDWDELLSDESIHMQEVHKHAARSPFNDYAFCQRIVDIYEELRPKGDDEGDGLFGLCLVEEKEKKMPRKIIPKHELKRKIEDALDVKVKICGEAES